MSIAHDGVTLYKGRTLHRDTRGNWQCAEVRVIFSPSGSGSLAVAERVLSSSLSLSACVSVCVCVCVLMQCAEAHENPVLFAKVDDFCAHMTEVHDAPELEVGWLIFLCA